MRVETIKNHINSRPTYIIGQWALLDGNLVIHKSDLFDVKDKYPQIEDRHIKDIKPLFHEQDCDPKEVLELAKKMNNKGLYVMAIYMHRGLKDMDKSYLKLKKRLESVKNNEIV